jgi:hypothetical protein
MTLTPPSARQASLALTRALVTIASQGLRTPCSDVAYRGYWISEHDMERKQAARWCVDWECPVLTECLTAALANDERAYVWGGRDLHRRPGRPRRAKQKRPPHRGPSDQAREDLAGL